MKLKLYKSTGVRKSAITKNPPAGTVIAYAGTSAPTGWLLCDGSYVTLTGTSANGDVWVYDYKDLFDVITGYYSNGVVAETNISGITVAGGGTGLVSTQLFKLPDLRGRVPYGASSVGTAGGSETVSLSTTQIGEPGHAHTFTETAHSHTVTETAHKHAVPYTNITTNTGQYIANNLNNSGGGINYNVTAASTFNFAAVNTTPTAAAGGSITTSFSIAAAAIAATAHTNIQPSLVISYIIKT